MRPRAFVLSLVVAALVAAPALAAPAAPADSAAKGVAAGKAAAPAPVTACVACHKDLDESNLKRPATLWAKDVHASVGLGCHDCHGGNPANQNIEDDDERAEAAMDPAHGFKPAPDRLEIPNFCARCHSDAAYMKRYNPAARVDQLIEYRTSEHGKRNAKGDTVPATCIDCHGAHGIQHVASPESPTYATNVPKTCAKCHADVERMAPYKIPTSQYDDYRKSVHATALLEQGDLAAPACNDCHGNHGAVPPEARSVANVCGQCHGREGALYSESIKGPLFEKLKMPECVTCHSNHFVRHPTPSMFDGRSAPEVSRGKVTSSDPFRADVGDLAPGDTLQAVWRNVLAPHLAPEDARYAHRVEIDVEGVPPFVLDATVRPGDPTAPAPARLEHPSGITAVLSVIPLSGLPVEAGDALRFRLGLAVRGKTALRNVTVRDVPGAGVAPHPGSACLKCHQVGDSCDVATEKIFASIQSLDSEIRQATALLDRAERAGMEVSRPQFELKRQGITADVEARTLIHSFDYGRINKRAGEGRVAAAAALAAGNHALAEMGVRRRGLAVSVALIVMALFALALKIRQVDRERNEREAAGPRNGGMR